MKAREQPNPAAVERIQALGYLGAFAPVTGAGAGSNPKDRAKYVRLPVESFNRALLLLGKEDRGGDATAANRQVEPAASKTRLCCWKRVRVSRKTDAALGEYDAAWPD